jgi:NADH-quinone oxidoreductase subunit B
MVQKGPSVEIEHTLDLHAADQAEGLEIYTLKERSQHPFPDPDQFLDNESHKSIILATADSVINWGRANSIYPHTTGPACCAFEFIAGLAARWDVSRFGMEIIRPSPRQADVLVVAGTVTWKMAPVLRRLYDQMSQPKWVIAMGVCAISGGTFRESYNVVPGVNRIMPVDIYIPGCPPRPEALYQGLMMLQAKIKKLSIGQPVSERWQELKQFYLEFPTVTTNPAAEKKADDQSTQ